MASMVSCDHRRRFLPRPGMDARRRGPTEALSKGRRSRNPRFLRNEAKCDLGKYIVSGGNSIGYVYCAKIISGFVFGRSWGRTQSGGVGTHRPTNDRICASQKRSYNRPGLRRRESAFNARGYSGGRKGEPGWGVHPIVGGRRGA
jgi:hypothetical protein